MASSAEEYEGTLNQDEILAVIALNYLGNFGNTSQDLMISKVYSYCPSSVRITLGKVLDELIIFIRDCNCNELAFSKVNELVCNQSKTCTAKDVLFQIEAVLKSVIVYHSYYNRTNEDINLLHNLLNDYNQYSEFVNSTAIDSMEMEYMSNFRYAMQAALRIIPAERNKRLLLTICAYL